MHDTTYDTLIVASLTSSGTPCTWKICRTMTQQINGVNLSTRAVGCSVLFPNFPQARHRRDPDCMPGDQPAGAAGDSYRLRENKGKTEPGFPSPPHAVPRRGFLPRRRRDPREAPIHARHGRRRIARRHGRWPFPANVINLSSCCRRLSSDPKPGAVRGLAGLALVSPTGKAAKNASRSRRPGACTAS
jgi:hypothetical protein